MGLEGPVSQLKAVPSSDTGNARFSAASKLAAPPVFAPLDERQLAQWELMTDQLLSAAQARPWHVRHARKLIGGAAVLVAVGFAFYSYYAWRLPAVPAAPIPVTVLPESAPVPAAAAAPALVPASPPAPAPARASVPRATVSRAIPAIAPVPPSPSVSTGPRVPAVTHTLRDEPAPTPAAAVAAPAAAVAAPPAAAPGDCPDAIVALGLCASHARKGTK
jgi:hypothetical protein